MDHRWLELSALFPLTLHQGWDPALWWHLLAKPHLLCTVDTNKNNQYEQNGGFNEPLINLVKSDYKGWAYCVAYLCIYTVLAWGSGNRTLWTHMGSTICRSSERISTTNVWCLVAFCSSSWPLWVLFIMYFPYPLVEDILLVKIPFLSPVATKIILDSGWSKVLSSTGLNSLRQKCNISCAMCCFESEQINTKRKKSSISFHFFQAPVLNIPAKYFLVYLLTIRKIQGCKIQPRQLQ